MIQLVPANADMFPEIYDALLRLHGGTVSRENWERTISHRWGVADDHAGYALVDGGKIVGFHGMIVAERTIEGKHVRCCNLHTWVVDESHRGHSMALLRPILRLKNHTFTDMTPGRQVFKLLRRLGFAMLDRRMIFLFPTRCADPGTIDVTGKTDVFPKYLNPNEVTLVRDHADSSCRPLVFSVDGEHCLVIYTAVRSHWISYCYIHHYSNSDVFRRYQGQIRRSLMKQSGCWFVAMDARMARDMTLKHAHSFPIPVRKLFKSDDLAPHQIDNLYTELSVGGFSGLPNFSAAVYKRWRSLLNEIRPGFARQVFSAWKPDNDAVAYQE